MSESTYSLAVLFRMRALAHGEAGEKRTPAPQSDTEMTEELDVSYDRRRYLLIQRIYGPLGLAFNALGAAAILLKSTKEMGSYKWYLFNYQVFFSFSLETFRSGESSRTPCSTSTSRNCSSRYPAADP